MGERVGHDAPTTAALQGVVADGVRCAQRFVDVAALEQPALLGVVGPYAGVAVGQQLEAHGLMLRELLRTPAPGVDMHGVGFDGMPHTEETPERPAFWMISVDET